MAGRSRTLSIEIVGDAKGLTGAFNEAERKADGFGRNVSKGAGVAAIGIASVGVAAAGAAVILGPKVLEMGASIEALGVKSATVFEGSVGDVEKWAAKNAASMGLTESALVGAAAGFGDLLKPMGFTAEQAATMSTDVLDVAGALSAWTGGTRSAAEVSEIMAKAMLGERDGLKELGISISDADVQARLAQKGQEGLTGAALEQAEALATQELIFEKSSDAQEAWADGSMDGIKAQNEMKASMSSLTESLVASLYPAMQAIVPVITEVATWLGENLPVAMAAVKEWTDENWPKIRDAIVTALEFVSGYISGFVDTVQAIWKEHGDRIMTAIKIVWDYVQGVVENALKVIQGVVDVVMGLIRGDFSEVWEGIKGIFSAALGALTNLVGTAMQGILMALDIIWETIKGIFSDAWESIKSTVSGAVEAVVGFVLGIPGRIVGTVTGMFSGIGDAIYDAREAVRKYVNQIVEYATGLPDRMAGIFSGMWDGIKSAFKSVINWVIRAWNGLEFTVPSAEVFGKKIGGWTIGVPDIPELHSGGTVGGASFAGLADDEVAAILRRGEVVLTPGQAAATAAGGGGNVYHITVEATPGTNRVELGREMTEIIGEFERSNGAGWRGSMVPV